MLLVYLKSGKYKKDNGGDVDGDVVDAEVPAVAADTFYDDEAVAFRAVEGVVILVPVADVANHRLQHGVAVYCSEQGAVGCVGGR